MSTDPELNHLIAKQEGRLVEMWYLDSFSKLLNMEGENKTTKLGLIHKHIRSITLNHFGADSLKGRLLPQIEECVNKVLKEWSRQPSVEVKHAFSLVSTIFSLKDLLKYDISN